MSAPLKVLIACEFTGTVRRGSIQRALAVFPSVARAMAEQWGGFALEMERIAA